MLIGRVSTHLRHYSCISRMFSGGIHRCKINRDSLVFDADYKPPSCPNCGKLTSPTKRSPDYNLRYLRYERQVFTCPACGEQTVRIMEVDGNLSS